MNRFDHQWQKLTALARSAPAEAGAAAPLGFATRVTARATSAPASWAGFERFALRGFMVAAAFGVAAIVFNYSTITTEQTDDLATADTVSDMLDLT